MMTRIPRWLWIERDPLMRWATGLTEKRKGRPMLAAALHLAILAIASLAWLAYQNAHSSPYPNVFSLLPEEQWRTTISIVFFPAFVYAAAFALLLAPLLPFAMIRKFGGAALLGEARLTLLTRDEVGWALYWGAARRYLLPYFIAASAVGAILFAISWELRPVPAMRNQYGLYAVQDIPAINALLRRDRDWLECEWLHKDLRESISLMLAYAILIPLEAAANLAIGWRLCLGSGGSFRGRAAAVSAPALYWLVAGAAWGGGYYDPGAALVRLGGFWLLASGGAMLGLWMRKHRSIEGPPHLLLPIGAVALGAAGFLALGWPQDVLPAIVRGWNEIDPQLRFWRAFAASDGASNQPETDVLVAAVAALHTVAGGVALLAACRPWADPKMRVIALAAAFGTFVAAPLGDSSVGFFAFAWLLKAAIAAACLRQAREKWPEWASENFPSRG